MSGPALDRQARAAREVIAHTAQHLGADLSVQLWDGTVLPLGLDARDDIRLIIASPTAIRRLLLKPGLMTLFELCCVGAREADAIAEIGAARTRLWLLYFSLFTIAFERGTCLVYQTLATKRQVGPSRLPFTRRDLYA